MLIGCPAATPASNFSTRGAATRSAMSPNRWPASATTRSEERRVGKECRDGWWPDSSRRRHTRFKCDWSSDVCSSDLAGLLGIAIAILIARSISAPLTSLVRDADRLSGGDTSVEFLDARRGDEIGDVAKSVARFRDN